VDYPNSAKAKKHYLVLSFDRGSAQKRRAVETTVGRTELPNNHVAVSAARSKTGTKDPPRKKKGVKTKEWIVHKKDSQRKKGKDVRPDTKFTARRRPQKF
jgi:18S rRNA (guanine1575-N7)-methyltransferase